jgi:signal transduction histidine kinase
MILAGRQDEPRLGGRSRHRDARTVCVMTTSAPSAIDRLSSWLTRTFTRENWERYRLPVEVGIAGLLFIGGSFAAVGRSGAAGVLVSLIFAALVVLYHRAPWAALLTAAFGTLVLAGALILNAYSQILGDVWLVVAVGLVLTMYGATSAGPAALRWTALAGLILAGLFFGVYTLVFFGGFGAGGLISTAALTVFVWGLLGIPWLAGWLVRSQRDRRRAQTAEVVVTRQRDRLQDDVTLEQERNRVARDVHDIVAHSLAVVIAQADGARYAAHADSTRTDPAAVDEALATIAQTARQSLSDVRSLLGELRHSQEKGPQPGVDDIDQLIRGFRESGLDIEWTSYGTASPMGDVAGLAVYRITQEALTNALKHGERGGRVLLEFDWADTRFSLTVTNPVGEADVAPSGGHGIPGMRERAALAGGDLAVGSGTNNRFRVRATLPLDRRDAPTQVYLREPV